MTEIHKLESSGTHTVDCNACNEENKKSIPVCYCKECNEFLCQQHFDEHKAYRYTKNHVTIPVSEGVHVQKGLTDRLETSQQDQDQTQDMTEQFRLKVNTGQVEAERQMGIPGRPETKYVTSDTIVISWNKPNAFGNDDVYQLSYKILDDTTSKWKTFLQDFRTNEATLNDLKAMTSFIFRVRVIHDEEEGPYSPVSDPIMTKETTATRIKPLSKIVAHSVPEVRSLPITPVCNSRNNEAKTQKFVISSMDNTFKGKEKTVMLVGETGTGKSTMIDGIVNYALGVNFDDPMRYTIINMENEETQKMGNEELSHIDWITCYTLQPEEGSRIDFTLNIIHTPGFGDTRGHKRDKQLVKQIHALFSSRDTSGVLGIDAICFLIKAPDARMTPTQNYIFQSVFSLFSKDVERNICSLITFADGGIPPVLSSLKQSGLPFGKYFTFNNSALFTTNKNLGQSSVSQMYWDISIKSFRAFFDHLKTMHTTSLEQTKAVLDTSQRLETTIQNLLPMVDVGLSILACMRQHILYKKQHQLDIEQNKDFLIPIEYTIIKQRNTDPGQYATNCILCNSTCHKYCTLSDNNEKKDCSAMSNGQCTQCYNKCHWTQHKSMPFFFEIEVETKLQSFSEKKSRYEEAMGKKQNCEGVLKEMQQELVKIKNDIVSMMKDITACNNTLKEIAIRLNPLSLVERIDVLIASEKSQKRMGFDDRIKELEMYKKEAQYDKVVEHFCVEESSLSAELA